MARITLAAPLTLTATYGTQVPSHVQVRLLREGHTLVERHATFLDDEGNKPPTQPTLSSKASCHKEKPTRTGKDSEKGHATATSDTSDSTITIQKRINEKNIIFIKK